MWILFAFPPLSSCSTRHFVLGLVLNSKISLWVGTPFPQFPSFLNLLELCCSFIFSMVFVKLPSTNLLLDFSYLTIFYWPSSCLAVPQVYFESALISGILCIFALILFNFHILRIPKVLLNSFWNSLCCLAYPRP